MSVEFSYKIDHEDGFVIVTAEHKPDHPEIECDVLKPFALTFSIELRDDGVLFSLESQDCFCYDTNFGHQIPIDDLTFALNTIRAIKADVLAHKPTNLVDIEESLIVVGIKKSETY